MNNFDLKIFFGRASKLLIFKSFLKQKQCRIFDWTHFRLWSAPSGGFAKNSTVEFSIFFVLVSLVLVKDSKNQQFCFGRGHLELFQCSAEGCQRGVTGGWVQLWISWVRLEKNRSSQITFYQTCKNTRKGLCYHLAPAILQSKHA